MVETRWVLGREHPFCLDVKAPKHDTQLKRSASDSGSGFLTRRIICAAILAIVIWIALAGTTSICGGTLSMNALAALASAAIKSQQHKSITYAIRAVAATKHATS